MTGALVRANNNNVLGSFLHWVPDTSVTQQIIIGIKQVQTTSLVTIRAIDKNSGYIFQKSQKQFSHHGPGGLLPSTLSHMNNSGYDRYSCLSLCVWGEG